MMYTSVPIHVYIICDDQAQTYIEKRLALVERPRHDIRIFFYHLSWQAMLARIEREGSIGTVHAAGTGKSHLYPMPAHSHGHR